MILAIPSAGEILVTACWSCVLRGVVINVKNREGALADCDGDGHCPRDEVIEW